MSDTRPHDVDRSDRDSPHGASVLVRLGVILGIYMGVFLLLILDEVIFHTYFVSRWLPGLEPAARILYFPLIWIGYRLGLLPPPPMIF